MFKHLLILSAFFILTARPPAHAATDAGEGIIGTILEVEGTGSVTSPGKPPVAAAIKTPVHLNDVIATGAKSRVFILFIDETQFTLSENTKMKVDKYVFDPDNAASNKGAYSVIDGSFKYVSGMMSKKKNPDVSINTNYGNIGIRGTSLWGGRLKDSYGVHVTEGRVRVRNDGGEVVVDKGKGTMVKSRKDKPTAAAPFPPEALQFIQSSVFLMGEAMLLKRIGGFKGENMLLRGKFKNFQQLNGLLPGGGALPIPGGGNFPIPGIAPEDPPQKGKKQGQKQPKEKGVNPLDMLGGFPR